jgi:hypothetical protein
MFEKFAAPCLRIEKPAVLALHASGCQSGLVSPPVISLHTPYCSYLKLTVI